MSCGGGADPVYETEADRESARIAVDQYNLSADMDYLKDFHESRVDAMGSQGQEDYVQGKANLGLQKGYSDAMDNAKSNLHMTGVDPSSGRSTGMDVSMHAGMGESSGKVSTNAAFEKDSQHLLAEQNVLGMSMGKAGQAQKGLNTIADLSVQDAIGDAFNDFNEHSANSQALGMAAGMGASVYSNS